MAALGVPYEKAQWRLVRTLSGGEQKRLVLEALLRGTDEVLLLDEPDNYLDVPGKRWLEERRGDPQDRSLRLHDRELLSAPPRRSSAWAGAPRHRHMGARRWLRDVPRGATGAVRPLRGAAQALGREKHAQLRSVC